MVQMACCVVDACGDELVGVNASLPNGQGGERGSQDVPKLVALGRVVLQVVQIVPKVAQEVHGVVWLRCKDRAQKGVDDVLVQVELVLEGVIMAGQKSCLQAHNLVSISDVCLIVYVKHHWCHPHAWVVLSLFLKQT